MGEALIPTIKEGTNDELEQVAGGINGAYKVYGSLNFVEDAPKRPFIPPAVSDAPIM